MYAVILWSFLQLGQLATIEGTVRDPKNLPVSEGTLRLSGPGILTRSVALSDVGSFTLEGIPAGTYELTAEAAGFAPSSRVVRLDAGSGITLDIVLTVGQRKDDITVTAEYGRVEERDRVPQQVSVLGEEDIRNRTVSVTAQLAAESAGIAVQRTSSSIGGIYVRGLTGKNVVVFVDGMRYTTSAQRGGINTFLNLNDASELQRIEVVRGPSAAQYGNDSLGGTINFLTRIPSLVAGGSLWNGEWSTTLNSATLGYGSSVRMGYSNTRTAFLVNGVGRRSNTTRPGRGLDTHAAVTRFLGLPSNTMGTRLPDTGFTQYGGSFRLLHSIDSRTQLVASYARNQQDGGKRYDQLLGGDGNNIADLRNLMLDLVSLRLDRERFLGFDASTLSFSYNSQRERRVNQGGNGNPSGAITSQYERLDAIGLRWSGSRTIRAGYNLLVGGEFYPESMKAPAFTLNPLTGRASPSRPRVPDGATYRSGGIFTRQSIDLADGAVHVAGSLRLNGSRYRSSAGPFWPEDRLNAANLAGSLGGTVRLHGPLSIHTNFTRGLRAPDMTDLGTLGLTGDGFEVAQADLGRLSASVGSTPDDLAVSTGRPVEPLAAERSRNFDAGLRWSTDRLSLGLTGFWIELRDTIVKQALILPSGAVGTVFLGGQPVVQQTAAGAVFVSLASNPVLVRTNLDHTRHYGVEYEGDVIFPKDWRVTSNFTWVRAADSDGRPPNVEGGTPNPRGALRFRYMPESRPFVIEVGGVFAAPQSRLSPLDLADRRGGGLRTRATIANFFTRGAVVRGLVRNGVLQSTGESLLQVQDRVLGRGVDRAPLVTRIPGYALIHVRATIKAGPKREFGFAVENLTDRNYRGVSWGMPGPGIDVIARFTQRF